MASSASSGELVPVITHLPDEKIRQTPEVSSRRKINPGIALVRIRFAQTEVPAQGCAGEVCVRNHKS